MKLTILLVLAVLVLAGCRSSQGGTSEKQYEYGTQTDTGQVDPQAGTSFRPGINREDVRDPQFFTRPQPTQVPSQTPTQ
ncbi:MAG TPA: hypothetical protein VL361_30015 [Candidatus Limnocylindrales bacterium]|nr:hypothetical protein [Candidatus Limnocylindrales bacterium]